MARSWKCGTAALVVLLLGGSMGLGYERREASLRKHEQQRAAARTEFENAQALLAKYRAEHERLQVALANQVVSLPDSGRFSCDRDLFQAALASLVKKHDLEIVSLEPAGEKPGSSPFYTRLASEVTVLGKYQDFVAFLQALSTLPQESNATDLQLEFAKDQPGKVRASFVLSTFRLLGP